VQGFVANTDYEWYRLLSSLHPAPDEVNFWRPSSTANFRALPPGAPLFFKLKAPHHAIAGLGFFAHFSQLPVSLAWEVYGPANGAPNFVEMRRRLTRLRSGFKMDADPHADFQIGCILLTDVAFFPEGEWVRAPGDWSGNIVQGKGYDLTAGEGARIWGDCLERIYRHDSVGEVSIPAPIAGGFGEAALIAPRLGQRSFRVAVLDAYQRRCAVTGERTLPVIEAAHIRDYSDLPEHRIDNGLALRSDLHRLFDRGYVTVDDEYRFVVSSRIREEFENGREYYALSGSPIRLPAAAAMRPSIDALQWHQNERFRG
jgi:putative restriction endonuclease